MDEATLNKMKVADLKKELKARGLAVTGNKTELVERLMEADGQEPTAVGDEEFDEEEILQETDAGDDAEKTATSPAKKEAEKKSPKKAATVNQENEPPQKVIKSDENGDVKSAIEKRAERFGIQSEGTKKEARAARFGITANGDSKAASKLNATPVPVDVEKLKSRAERFGEVCAKTILKAEDSEKKKARQERFGIPEAEQEKIDAAKAARAERFASTTKKTEETTKDTEETKETTEVKTSKRTPITI